MERFVIIFLVSNLFGIFNDLPAAEAITRKVTTTILQPDGDSYKKPLPNLFHTKAVGPHDTMHYITGTYGTPSILVARTQLHTDCKIKWNDLLSYNLSEVAHSISFSTKPFIVYGIQFLQLIEYDDSEDKANMTKANPNMTHKYNLGTDLPWLNSTLISDLAKNEIVFKIEDNYTEEAGGGIVFMTGGSLSFKIKISNETHRAPELPHLEQTANTTQIDVILDHLLPQYNKTRYALEILYLTSDGSQSSGSIQLHTHTSIDDEHTPGVFQIIDISTNITPSSFIQWKPVCYKAKKRSMKTATKVKDYPLQSEDSILPSLRNQTSLLYAYFGESMYSTGMHEVAVFNLSFGLSQDKFYADTYYIAWSFSLGYGEAPPEQVSLFIIIIISMGLGIPALVIMFGSLGACIHKKKNEGQTSYTVIN